MGEHDAIRLEIAQYAIWISAKLQGPAYAPGSKKENALIVDRIIVTKE